VTGSNGLTQWAHVLNNVMWVSVGGNQTESSIPSDIEQQLESCAQT
jgi:hypothetical protein